MNFEKQNIANDCMFPEDWTVEDLLSKHKSRPYNPLIANTFFRAGFIESWGRGIQKIQEGCEEANIPLPEYTVKKEDLMVMFKSATQATTQTQSLSVNDQKLLQCIQKNPSFSQKQIAQELHWTIDNVKYYVKKLKSANLLEYTGTSQKGKWIVKKGGV